MNKDVSLQLKGVAILMMLFLHLFNQMSLVELCDISVYFWNGKPLVLAFSRVCAFCVPVYLFLSGYGLSWTYDHQGGVIHRSKRIWRLYVNYWVVILLFIPLAAYLVPENYPGDMTVFLFNFIGWHCTYNYEWWFLFPYILLLFCCPYLIRYMRGINSRRGFSLLILVFTALYFGCYAVQNQWKSFFNEYDVLQQFRQFIYCLYPFMFGVLFQQNKILQKCKYKYMIGRGKNIYLYVSLLILCVLRMMLGPSIINPYFVLVFIILFNSLTLPSHIRTFLMFMGSHSTNMWLVHTFFAYYLFQDFIYGLKYPLFMYAVLLLLSLASSYIIRFCYQVPHLFSSGRLRNDM